MSGTVYALSSNPAVSQNKESYGIGGLDSDNKTGRAWWGYELIRAVHYTVA
jgi:hypothetical protein